MRLRSVCAAVVAALVLAMPAAGSATATGDPSADHSETAELDQLLAQSLARKQAERAEREERRRQQREREEAESVEDIAADAAAMATAPATEPEAAEDFFNDLEEQQADTAATPSEDPFVPDIIEEFRSSQPPYNIGKLPRLEAFDRAIRTALKQDQTFEAANAAAAPWLELEGPALATFVRLWIEAELHNYGYSDEAKAERAKWLEAFIAFASRHGDSALVLEAVASQCDSEECGIELVKRLLDGRADRVAAGWRIAAAQSVRETTTAFALLHPERAIGALMELEHYGWLEPVGKLPLGAWLVRDEVLARVAPNNRAAVSAVLYRRHLKNLLSVGFSAEAVAFADTLDPEMRMRVLEPDVRDFFASIDGLPVYVRGETNTDGLRGWMASAYWLEGREDAARAILEKDGALEKQREWLACITDETNGTEPTCTWRMKQAKWALVLGYQLDTPDADPYPLAEVLFSGRGMNWQGGGTTVEVICRVFAKERFGNICQSARSRIAYKLTRHTTGYNREDHDPVVAALSQMALSGYAALDSKYAALTKTKLTAIDASQRPTYERASIDPLFPDFALRPLPEGLAAYSPPKDDGPNPFERVNWPEGWANLDPGFWPVRWEQEGARVAAISVSSFYNPSGEISQGGYWVHMSRDGGRSWDSPMFTGLAQYWPYVVTPQSALPMLRENRLEVEVAILELDTASITYPPVGIRTRREQQGLMIDLPFSRLSQDSDTDGLSDLTEAHLLLNRTGKDRPFILGTGDSSGCPTTPSRDMLATIALLGELFETESRAIIEPINRNGDALDFGKWQRKEDALAPPLFLRGDPADFACIDAARPVLVYSEAQVKELQRRSPDFRTIELPKGVWNADRTRGYVEWSAGWTGGTLLLQWTGGEWQIETISSWIT